MTQAQAVTSASSGIPAFRKPPAYDGADALGHAAGVIYMTQDGDVLLLHRGRDEQNYAGHWALPGGKVEDGEDPEDGARRESLEEIGAQPERMKLLDRRKTPNGMAFHTFVAPVKDRFAPRLNGEHSGYTWASLDQLPGPMHPAVQATINDRIGAVADMVPEEWDALRSGLLKWIEEERNEAEHLENGDASNQEIKLRQAHDSMRLALDRDSVREFDADGRLRVALAHISKATVNPYYGEEIPDWEALGLDPKRKYMLLRDPEELRKAAPTFNSLPLLRKHVPVSADDHQSEEVVGALGTDAVFSDPYLDNSLMVWTADAIAAIESGEQRELSCGYRYRADMTPGNFHGTRFDGVMRDIVGNHVALVKDGRAGKDVVVGDAAFSESDHPRSPDGKFGSGGGTGGTGKSAKAKREAEAKNIGKGLGKAVEEAEAAEKKFPKGTRVRANRVGAPAQEVVGYRGNMLVLTSGDMIHATKAVRAHDQAIEDNMDPVMNIIATRQATIGALVAYVRPRIAMDQKISIAKVLADVPVGPKFKAMKPQIAARLREQSKGKLAADASLDDVEKVLDMLDAHEVAGAGGKDADVPEEKQGAMEATANAIPPVDIPAKDETSGLRDFLRGKGMSEDDINAACDMLPKPEVGGTDADPDDEDEIKAKAKAKDADPEEKDKPMDKKAMDAAIAAASEATAKRVRDEVLQQQRGIQIALDAVRPYIGNLAPSLAFDSGEAVYRHTLKALGVEGAETIHASALETILRLRPKPGSAPAKVPQIGMDNASQDRFAKRFPQAGRIGIG